MTETTQNHPPSPRSTSPDTAPLNGADLKRRNNQVIYLLLAATFVVFLNETIMNVALVPLMNDLRIDESTVQWLSTSFMLTMAVIIPTTGFLLQRLTTRQVFILAMTLFSIGTALAVAGCGWLAELWLLALWLPDAAVCPQPASSTAASPAATTEAAIFTRVISSPEVDLQSGKAYPRPAGDTLFRDRPNNCAAMPDARTQPGMPEWGDGENPCPTRKKTRRQC